MRKEAVGDTGKRVYWCNIRLTDKEFNELKDKLTTTTCRKVSDYVRNVLFEKPITVRQRNQSMDEFMTELIRLRFELNALGNNFNQVVKKLNSIPPSAEYRMWLSISKESQRELLVKIEKIQVSINKFSGEWFQK